MRLGQTVKYVTLLEGGPGALGQHSENGWVCGRSADGSVLKRLITLQPSTNNQTVSAETSICGLVAERALRRQTVCYSPRRPGCLSRYNQNMLAFS